MNKSLLVACCSLFVFALFACHSPKPDPYKDDTTTSGHVLVLADEDLRNIVDAEKLVFESIYTNAQLDIRYMPEAQLLKAMMNDSVRCVIATVKPGADQEAFFAKRRITAHVVPICTDGIAVVMNKSRNGNVISTDQLRLVLDTKNEEPLWSLFEPMQYLTLEKVVPIFTSPGSGIGRVLIDSLALGGLRGSARASVDELINDIAANAGHIGFVPFAAISDLDNPHMRALRDRVMLLSIGSDTSLAVLPSQSTLADGQYPLRREVYMILAEGKSGLGTGFVSFVANHKGQRILLKLGVAPHKVPAREVEIVH